MARMSWASCLLVAVFLVLSVTATADVFPYHYNGLYGVRTGTFHITLDRETVRNGHVDVWVGADNGLRWVQAGVAHDYGHAPYVYIETTGGRIIHVREGRSATVTLSCDRFNCTASVEGASMTAYLPAASRLGYTGGESWEPDGYQNSYYGHIDGAAFSR